MIMASTHAISGIPSLKTFRHSNSNSPKFPLSSNFWTSYYSHPQFPNSNPNSNFLQLSLSLSSSSMASTVRATSSSASVGTSSSSVVVGESDLLIVGPGVLGRLVAQQWSQNFPGCQIYGKTATTDNHDELINIGITPSVKEAMLPCQFPYVIFCAPPSKSPDYAGDVREAASSWNGKGSFVFTSSSGLVDCTDNGNCDEDAASLAIAILKKNLRSRVFLGCDNHPLSRQEIMDLVIQSGKFSGRFEGFTGANDSLGKRLNNSKTRAEIGWEPKYPSFAEFLKIM
uniref:Uncharacterized protein n=1 Tax=Chenopodium quinoa TaxID=63459 RepID=A0A803L7A7_CHEQI